MAGFICLLSATNGSPSGEKMLEGWNDRTDLHLSLQPTLTAPIAYRNDQWCRGVWGSQQVHSAFLMLFHSGLPHRCPSCFLPPFPCLLMAPHEAQRDGPDRQPPRAPGMSQLTPGSPFSAPPRSHGVLRVRVYHTPASCYNLLQLSAVPSQTRRQRGDNPPYALSAPKHPTSMTEAVQMPLESAWTQLPSSSVERTKAAFSISHPRACCHLLVPAESPPQRQLSSGAPAGARSTQPHVQHAWQAAAIPAQGTGVSLRALWRGLEYISVAPSQKHLVSKQHSPTSHHSASSSSTEQDLGRLCSSIGA